jgi:A/G-specific adenine glycosylase
VLVGEVMLQQTPVARVTPVWPEWPRRWPTPAALAADGPGEAIRAWGRLGYPRRALRLHASAQTIVASHGGHVPRELPALLELPGVGAYTARAVATFAYGERHAVIDTNVRRLVARAAGGLADGPSTTTVADLATVESLLPAAPARAARASVAFMELGALVCVAGRPSCERCPLRTVCAWRSTGHPPQASPHMSPHVSRRRSQRYAGTDRQVRGLLLALARDSTAPVGAEAIEAAWPEADQRRRALAGLLHDGLLVEAGTGGFALPCTS